MRPVITPDESARLDSIAEEPVGVLMERAGLRVAVAAARMGVGYGDRVLVLAGPGNNGGDGYVAARHLRRRGIDVAIRALGDPKGDDSPSRVAAAAAVAAGVSVEPLGLPEPADLTIDALFGAGFRGSLPDAVAPWTQQSSPVLAVDLPSGLDGHEGTASGPVFRATRTVTFDAVKTGHVVVQGPAHTGALEVARIGLPEPRPAFVLCDDDDAPRPRRADDAHKWSVGSVAVVGGSSGLIGAPVMAAEAALRFGAGAVRLIVPSGLRPEAATGRPGIMTEGIGGADTFGPDDADVVLEAVDRFDTVILGPGLGPGQEGLVESVLDRWSGPLVLDADGIGATDLEALTARSAPTVLTPHAGEFERLTGMEAGPASAFALAEDIGGVIVLKGSPTFVAGAERWAVDSGGPELATIGTGDVLAGMIGALVGRGLEAEVAARSAAHWHGRAGSSLAAVTSVTAVGLLEEIGRWAS